MKSLQSSLCGVAAVLLCLCPVRAPAQSDGPERASLPPEVQGQLKYAEGLIDMGLPGYGEQILDRIEAPAAGSRIRVLRLRALIARGQFDEARQVIAGLPDPNSDAAWTMKLAMADGLYAWDRYGAARGLYEGFFARYPEGPPEASRSFYVQSAYKYAQMLRLMGDREAAIKAYRYLLAKGIERRIQRQVLSEMAEVYLQIATDSNSKDKREAALAEVKKLARELLWVQDVWFGKAIGYLAHARLLEGDVEGAQELIEEYRDELVDMDRRLAEQSEETGEDLTKLSPMAECRYLLGVMMQEEAERLIRQGGSKETIAMLLAGRKLKDDRRTDGALQHFLNIFIRYPNTQWAADAGVRARKIEGMLQRQFGVTVRTNVSDEQMERVKQAQFQEAHVLFTQQQYRRALESYKRVLNLFPEEAASVAGLGDVARCAIELQDELYAEMVIRYLAERFRERDLLSTDAGDELLRIAEYYGQRARPDRRETVYQLYFSNFQHHPRAAAVRFRFAEEMLKDNDLKGAIRYYEDLAGLYTNSPLYFDALNRIAHCYHQMGDKVGEIKSLTRYVKVLEAQDPPGHAFVNAKYRLASAYRELGGKYTATAFNRYHELVQTLEGDRTAYQKTREEAETNTQILEGSLFYEAMCLAALEGSPEKVRAYKREAVKVLTGLVDDHPDSTFAPAALSQAGTLWTILDDPDGARRTLQRLQREYPDSNEAHNALFMLGNNLLKLGMEARAVRIFEDMFAAADDYSDAQIITVGNEMIKSEHYGLALRAFETVLKRTDVRAHREPALLGKGRALIETSRYAEGAKTLETLLAEYPNSGYTVEVCYALSRAYRTLAIAESDDDARFELFNKAVRAMKRVRQFEKTKGGRARSDLEVARIFAQKAHAEETYGSAEKAREYRRDAIAAYETLILLQSAGDPDVRPTLEEAYHECIPLLLEIERWADVVQDCERYLEEFPMGRYVVDIRNARNQARVRVAATPIDNEDSE